MAVHVTALPHASFTMLRNCWLRDRRISLKAKGLLGYLRSHAEGYRCSQAQMIADSNDGRSAVRSALAELEEAGYLVRTATRSSGRFAEDDYALTDPFDALGNLQGAETAPSPAAAGAETSQRRFTDAEKPQREIAPIEDQEKKTSQKASPSGQPAGSQLALVEEQPAAPPPGRRRTKIPEGWQPSPETRAAMDAECPGWHLREPVAEFVHYWRNVNGRPMADWEATWRNRVRQLAVRQTSNGHRPQGGPYRDPPRDSYVAGPL